MISQGEHSLVRRLGQPLWERLAIAAKSVICRLTLAKPVDFRAYRYWVQQIHNDLNHCRNGRSIIFTSPDSLGYCNETLLLFAHFLQNELDCRVLLVDASYGITGISSYLKLTGYLGFFDLIYNDNLTLTDLIKPTPNPHISVLAAGQSDKTNPKPIKREKLQQLLQQASYSYDYVLVQQGSILDDTRYLFLATLVDLVVVLVQEGHTRLDTLQECQKMLQTYQVGNVRVAMLEAR
jgi:hypothetical protein